MDDGPISTLVEWRAPTLTPQVARGIASRTIEMIGQFPGFVEGRFFGDFDTGIHYYLLTWRDRAALDDYVRGEQMLGVRALAAPYVEGRPARTIALDYTPRDRVSSGDTIPQTAPMLRGRRPRCGGRDP